MPKGKTSKTEKKAEKKLGAPKQKRKKDKKQAAEKKLKKEKKDRVQKEAKKAEPKIKKIEKRARYWEGVGRRKTAIARVRIFSQKKKEFLVNEKNLEEYFPGPALQQKATAPFRKLKLLSKFMVSVKTKGGGITAQAEAIRHGSARALVKFNSNFRKKLKKAGYLRRDPRMKERKKFGLKRARRAPQWQKR